MRWNDLALSGKKIELSIFCCCFWASRNNTLNAKETEFRQTPMPWQVDLKQNQESKDFLFCLNKFRCLQSKDHFLLSVLQRRLEGLFFWCYFILSMWKSLTIYWFCQTFKYQHITGDFSKVEKPTVLKWRFRSAKSELDIKTWYSGSGKKHGTLDPAIYIKNKFPCKFSSILHVNLK